MLHALTVYAQSPAPFRFVAIGDMGSASAGQRQVAERMWEWREKHPFNFVLMLGDNIYGNTELTHGGDPRYFPQKFDAYYSRFQQQGVVFHAALGNHDMQTNHGQPEIDDKKRFGILGDEGYYKFTSPPDFNVGSRPLVEFFVLNSEIKDGKVAQQAAWLDRELKQSTAVWKFVFMHEPLYTVRGPHGPDVSLRAAIHDSLKQNHVQFILSGHNHFYARMKPVDGMVQLISGGGGRPLASPKNDHCAETTAGKYHFLGVEVLPDKVHFEAIDQEGGVIDETTEDSAYLARVTKGCPER
jgi:acid phosphatase